MMKTLIISVGNEVASGHIVNSNAAWIAKAVEDIGLTPERTLVLRDDEKTLTTEIRKAAAAYNVVFITGGLGPTSDDVTKPALVKAFNTKLVRDAKTMSMVKRIFKMINRPMGSVNEGQADVPESAIIIQNRWGTAPCIHFDTGKCLLFAMPGVPYEMKKLMEHGVIPLLKKRLPKSFIHRSILRLVGVGESKIYSMITEAGGEPVDAELAYLPHPGLVDLRITAATTSVLRRAEKNLMNVAAPYCYGKGADTLQSVIGELLARNDRTLASAESCTGGLFAARITSVPGASRYFLEGAVTYSNDAKINRLGVKEKTLIEYGAVSEQTAKEMAEGIRETSGADYGISATGIAGPDGGTKEKPVGLVYVGFSDKNGTEAVELRFSVERAMNQERTVIHMLERLWRELSGVRT